MTVLVTGATGKIGRHVVDNLLAAGSPVRVLTRDPGAAVPAGVTIATGDLTDPAAVASALAGVDEVFLYPILDAVGPVVDLAARAGVRRIVLFTGAWAAGHTERDRQSWTYPRYREAESTVESSPVPEWTILRPAPFATNLLWWARSIRADGVVRAPYGRGGSPLIHEQDIADCAAVALTGDGHAGARYTLTGPAFVSQLDQVAALSTAIGRDIDFQELTPEQWRAAMSFVRAGILDDMLREWSETAADPDSSLPVTTTVEELTGKPARSVAEWAIDHAEAFR